jgi:hypothetical protein
MFKCSNCHEKFGSYNVDGKLLCSDCRKLVKDEKHEEWIQSKALFLPESTDEEIQQNILEDMSNLAGHEAGTKWMRVGTLLSGNSTDQILGAGLKAIIDQNKIIIRQNELLLREARKKNSNNNNP